MRFVSDFADQAVILPLALIVTLLFGVLGWWRGLVAWAVAVGFTLGTMLVLKAGFVVYASDMGSNDPASPSGHVAAACVVYGGLAILVLRGTAPRWLMALLPLAVVVVVGASRIVLLAHTPLEVVAGAVVGLGGVMILAITAGPRPNIPTWPVLTAAASTAVAFHGMHLPAEAAIRYTFAVW